VDERNDFWRNTPGEQDGNTSGEILLQKKKIYVIFVTIDVRLNALAPKSVAREFNLSS